MAEAGACSILVPVYNEERAISASLDAMCAQDFDGKLEILIADGGSTDATRAIVRERAVHDHRIRLLENPRGSVSSGLNVCLAHARGTWVARMDAHTVYPADYVRSGVRRLERGGTRWVSGPQLPQGHNRVSRAVGLALSSSLGRGASRKWSDGGRTEFELDTGVFAGVWRRSTLLEYGGWDEGWLKNEDSELAARFLARDEVLICVSQMAAKYTPRDSLTSLWKQYRGYGRFRMRTARTHPSSLRPSLMLPFCITSCLVAAMCGPLTLRRLARFASGVYILAISRAGVRARGEALKPTDAATVPLALATMHLAFGIGTAEGIGREGFPLSAITAILGLRHDARNGDVRARPWAPSLTPPLPRSTELHASDDLPDQR